MKLSLQIIICLGLASSVGASPFFQADCNNTSRAAGTPAGHSSGTTSCPSITIGPLTTPSSCNTHYTFTSQNVYTCNGSSVPNVHCFPNGYQVKTESGTGGGCPGAALGDFLDGFDPLSPSSWRELPGALWALSSCTPMVVTTSFDWSAKSGDCVDGKAPIQASISELETIQPGAGGGTFLLTLEQSELLYNHETSLNPFISEYDAGQTGTESQVPGEMGNVLDHHQGLAAVGFSAKVKVKSFDAEEQAPSHVEVVGVTGSIREDGLFEVTIAEIIPFEGEQILYLEKASFDGSALTTRNSQNPYGNIWPIGSAPFADLWGLKTRNIEPIFRWCVDPFDFPLFSEPVEFDDITDTSSGVITASRSFDDNLGNPFVSTEYSIMEGPYSHPYKMTYKTPFGNTSRIVLYSDYMEISPGNWRPRVIETTYFTDASPSGRRTVVELTFLDAYPLTSAQIEAIPSVSTEQKVWQVW